MEEDKLKHARKQLLKECQGRASAGEVRRLKAIIIKLDYEISNNLASINLHCLSLA